MIEDASVAIYMLNGVSLHFVPGSSGTDDASNQEKSIHVNGSQILRCIELDFIHKSQLNNQKQKKPQKFRLRIGMEDYYYSSGLPDPLQKNATIQFYAVLFEMRIYILKFGANTKAQARNQIVSGAVSIFRNKKQQP